MKKNRIWVLVILLLMPLFLNADTFDLEKGNANGYLQRDAFSSSYKKYLLYSNLRFGFDNGRAVNNSNFYMGGFISEQEYRLTIPQKGSSYLLSGDAYWTLTPNGSKYKVIEYSGDGNSNIGSYVVTNTKPKARVTEYVAPNTSVSGTGKLRDPWYFDPMFRVNFIVLGGHGKIEGSTENIGTDREGTTLSNIYLKAKCKEDACTKTIKILLDEGYDVVSNDCDGTYNPDTKTFTINYITKDLECKLKVGTGKFTVELTKGNWIETKGAKPSTLYLRQRDNYYKEKSYVNIVNKLDQNPERYGYTFKGYYIPNTTIRIIDGTGKVIDKTSITKNEKIISDWQKNKYTITFDPNGGNINVNEKTSIVTFDEPYGILPSATRAGYLLKGWYTSATNNELIKESDIVKYAGNRTLYAQWDICPKGTYNNGNSTTCLSCPNGYTSEKGSIAENQCYMIVGPGKYLITKASSALPCEKGTARNGEVKRYYGESIRCNNCLPGYYQNQTGQINCKECPKEYTSNIKATAKTQCFITVPEGNKLVAESTPSLCDAGTFRKDPVVANFGSSVSCIKCVAGSYQDKKGQNRCIPCKGGKTSTTGASSVCTTNCSNSTGISGWKDTIWNDNNTVTNLCTPNSCGACYSISNGKCVTSSTFYVSSSGNDSNNGTSASSPFATIQKAYNCPPTTMTIKLTSNITQSTQTHFNQNKTVTLTSNSGIYTITRGKSLIGDGSNEGGALLFVEDGNVTLTSLTMDGNSSQVKPKGPLLAIKGKNTKVYLNSGLTLQNNKTIEKHPGGINMGGYSTATMNGAIIKNNSSNGSGGGQGGGVQVAGNGKFILNSGSIINNTSDGRGGGFSIYDGDLTVNGGTISNNTASKNGGGIWVGNGTSTLSTDNPSSLKIVDGIISNNTANYGGGVHASKEASIDVIGNISGGKIQNNTANQYGGGIYNAGGKFDITNVQITGNKALEGGGIFISNYGASNPSLKMTGGTISNNTATGGSNVDGLGGGIYIAANSVLVNSYSLSISNVKMLNNNAVYGGAIAILSHANNKKPSLTLQNNTISQNNASKDGGAIYLNNSKITVSSGTISNNKATYNGGGICTINSSESTLSGGSTTGNSAAYGGGVYVFDSNSTIQGSTNISSNTSSVNGGGIWVFNSNLTLTNGTISYNTAQSGGGGIYFDVNKKQMNNGSEKTLTMSNGNINYNKAKTGGGIFVTGDGSRLKLNAGNISYNIADNGNGGGGVALWYNVIAELNKIVISGNKVNGLDEHIGGGGIRVVSSSLWINNATITNNEASGRGGGIQCATAAECATSASFPSCGSVCVLYNGTISGNTAYKHGGGIDISINCGTIYNDGFQTSNNRNNSVNSLAANEDKEYYSKNYCTR